MFHFDTLAVIALMDILFDVHRVTDSKVTIFDHHLLGNLPVPPNENELHLYEEARSYLKVHGTTKQTEDGRTIVANPSLKSINEKLTKLYSVKNQQYEDWKETDRRYKEILTVNYNYRTMNDLPAQRASKEEPVQESLSPEKETKKDTQQL